LGSAPGASLCQSDAKERRQLLIDPDDAPRLANEADLPALREIVRAAYDPYLARMARRKGLDRLTLYTNEVMTENLAIYGHLGYREVGPRTEGGYRRVFMEKVLPLT
jgi:hypothetical protein